MTSLSAELTPKRLEFLHEMIPTAGLIAVLVNPTSPTAESQSRNLQVTARDRGLQLHFLQASKEQDFDTVFATLPELRAAGLVFASDTMFRHAR